jgi:hypothetical protein
MDRSKPGRLSGGGIFLVLAALFWAGMIAGVSGLATPIKFSAPSLTLPVALDVGRVTFGLFSRVEWALALVLIVAGLVARPPLLILLLILVAVSLVALQTLWLLPILGERTAAVIAGNMVPPSSHHVWYVVIEIVKFAALLAVGIGAMRGPAR